MVLIWEVFWASNTFNNLTGSFSKLTQNWLSGDFLTTFFKLGAANLGGSVPFWATLTHLFWWGLIIISTLLGLFLMRGLRKMDIFEKLAISGLLGVIILSILSLFGTTRGSQFYRFLLYAPLFCAPILLGFLFKSKIWGRLITIGLVIVMFVGSLPTFLSSVNTISTDAIRAYDINGGAFLADNGYGNGDNLTFFRVSPSTAGWVYYYLPDVNKHTIEERAFFDQTLFWEKLNLLVSQYNKAEGNCVFVVDTHTYVNTEHLLGIHPEDSGWQSLNSAFNQTDMIYTNGNVQIYSRQ
jgi:hypothetical protein